MADWTLYSQMDPQWKLKRLGTSREATIGSFGCLLTDMAMIASVYGYQINPLELNSKMKGVSGFQGAYIMPYLLPKVLPGITYQGVEQCYQTPAPMARIDAWLEQGKPVIVEVDYSPKQSMQNHWIILYARQNGDYLLYDPWPYPIQREEILLTKSRYAFAGKPKEIITQVLFFDGKLKSDNQASNPVLVEPHDLNQASFSVYVSVDGLAIRSEPFVDDSTLINRLPINSQLRVFEEKEIGLARLGKEGEWLRVKDDQGQGGYVAAWYVALEQAETPLDEEPVQEPAAGSDVLVVKTIADGVALRSQARPSPDTLIRYLPLFTNLINLEDKNQAALKIGKRNQWLKVEDINGTQGYIAAWYLTTSDQTAFGARKKPTQLPIEPVPWIVYPQVDQLAMRSQALVSETTLIKRLPLNTDLLLLDPVPSNLAKIGVLGEWLIVRDISKAEGYVAAWYLAQHKYHDGQSP